MASEQFSLCWDNFHKNMSSGMNSLLENEDLVDVTLAVEGKYLKAHKMVLSVCSPYFRELFKVNPCKHPIVFMKDVSYIAMSDLLQFMYQGEVQVSQENLTTFIKTAEALQIKGLTGDGNGSAECDNETQEESKAVEHEMPKMAMTRPKKMHQTPPAPAPKRPRLSAPEPSSTPAVTKTEPIVASTPTNEQLIQFKMEPYDQGQSSVTIPDDNPDDTFTDDPLDETNADDGNEDYSMMEGGDEEPQAGTSADGTAGEGQVPRSWRSSASYFASLPSSLEPVRSHSSFNEISTSNERIARLEFNVNEIQRTLSNMECLLINLNGLKTLEQFDTQKETRNSIVDFIPCRTLEEVDEIERNLKNPKFKLAFEEIMFLTGGEDIHKCVYNIMKKLLTPGIVLSFSGLGRKQKRPFCSLEIYSVIINAVRRRFAEASDIQIKKSVSQFLATGKDRLPKRNRD